jgi:dolichol-phosphate mannosyltransferase
MKIDSRAVILIPTYNEATSIVELLRALGEIQVRQNFDAIILDDNSPDKTADSVD